MIVRMIKDWGYPQYAINEMVNLGVVSPDAVVLKPFWVVRVRDWQGWDDEFHFYPTGEKPLVEGGSYPDGDVEVYRVCPAPYPKAQCGGRLFYQEFGV